MPKFYPGIELLRGLSALWVMLFHLDSRLPSTLPLLLQPIAAAGWMGVGQPGVWDNRDTHHLDQMRILIAKVGS